MNWVNPATQQIIGTAQTDKMQLDQTQPPTPEQLLKYGWRYPDPTEPPLAPGYERLARRYVQDPARAEWAILSVTDGSIVEREAREAAAAAEKAAEKAAWQALKAAVQAIDPALIDKTPFADAAQKASIQAVKNAVKDLKDALKQGMDYMRIDA